MINRLIQTIYQFLPNINRKGIIGCSQKEIEYLEKMDKVKFPKLFMEFLSIMGKNAGGFLSEYYCFYEDLVNDLNKDTKKYLEEYNVYIPPNSYFFLSYAGYNHACFLVEETNDNPIVYFYYETGDKNNKYSYGKYNSLYDFYISRLELQAKVKIS